MNTEDDGDDDDVRDDGDDRGRGYLTEYLLAVTSRNMIMVWWSWYDDDYDDGDDDDDRGRGYLTEYLLVVTSRNNARFMRPKQNKGLAAFSGQNWNKRVSKSKISNQQGGTNKSF